MITGEEDRREGYWLPLTSLPPLLPLESAIATCQHLMPPPANVVLLLLPCHILTTASICPPLLSTNNVCEQDQQFLFAPLAGQELSRGSTQVSRRSSSTVPVSVLPPHAAGGGASTRMRLLASGGSAATIQGAGGDNGCKLGGPTALDGRTIESLWCTIMDLARIVDLADNPCCWGASTCPSVVHIVGVGVTSTLMDLPLSALHVLSQADAVLHKDVWWIVLDCCNIVCVGKMRM
jgi:hypothetical protein